MVLDRPSSPFHKNVVVLTCTRGEKDGKARPTAANIRKAVDALSKGKSVDDIVLVALAGHGVVLDVDDPDRKGPAKPYPFFCPQDADLTGVSYSTGRSEKLLNLTSDLFDKLTRCGAGARLVLMDACRNVEKAEAATRSLDASRVTIPVGVAAMFSCQTGQFARETSRLGKGHGVFFYHVVQGLKDRKAAREKAGDVDWFDLVNYAHKNVKEDVPKLFGASAKQTPEAFSRFTGTPVLLPGLPQAREITNSIGMKLMRISPGKFTMGSPDDEKERMNCETEHLVQMRGYYMSACEVTQKQFQAVMGYNPSWFRAGGRARPSWTAATRPISRSIP